MQSKIITSYYKDVQITKRIPAMTNKELDSVLGNIDKKAIQARAKSRRESLEPAFRANLVTILSRTQDAFKNSLICKINTICG
ncbi:hypothetical protein ABLA30_01270 [Xenorhabdus nematophila]|uniref:hypothetical protein n=1 Tax=Xenorhabdus nematophila TaxID=628 RepID=UPI0032B872DC